MSKRPLMALAMLAGSVGLVASLAAFTAEPHADPVAARREMADCTLLLARGNYSAARSHAQAAIRADPGSADAQALLARSFLALEDGVAAEGALDRATSAGIDLRRTHHLYAHAWLLEGDAQRALSEARRADPRYAGYAIRIGAQALAAQGDMATAQAALGKLLAIAPRDAAAYGDLAAIKYRAGDVAGAIGAAHRAVELDPANVANLTLRGTLVRAQFGLVAALPWYESALAHDAYYHPALIEYAATLGEVGRYADMLAATRKALAARPGSASALYLQAVLAARAGSDDLARTLLLRTNGALAEMPGAQLLTGTLAYRAGAYQQAVDSWRALVAQQPTNIVARRLLGAALLRIGDPQRTLDTMRPVAVRADADSYTLALVGRAFEQSGQSAWATRYLDRSALPQIVAATPFGVDDGAVALSAAAAAPGEPVAQLGAIRALIGANASPAAAKRAQALVAVTPGAPTAWIALGDTLMTLDRPADAAAAYRHAADLRFDEPTMLRAVDAFERANQRAAAANMLALFLGQNPQNVAAQRLSAHWQIAAGDWDAAIATLESLRQRLGNRDAGLLAELSYAYTGDGDPETGRVYGKAAYRLAPMNPAASDAYGWALYQQGSGRPALELLEKAASIAPDRPELRWHLAQAYADLDRSAEAITQIHAAFADPRFGDRAAAVAALKALG